MEENYLYGVVGLFFDGQKWQLSFATSSGYRHTSDSFLPDNDQSYTKIIKMIREEFSNHRLTSSRVFLLYSPPGSDSLFPILYQNFPPVIVVHPQRLMLHRERLGKKFVNKSEMLVDAAITGLTTDLLLIETTNACTFSCLFCPQDQMTRKKERLPFETAQSIIKEYAANGVGSVAFHLMGEPTSNPYLPQLVKLAADLHIEHTLTTNASTLTKEMSKDLFKNGLKRAQLSVQTFGEKQFYAFKRPSPKYSYETVLENIKNFIIAKWQYAPDAEIEIHVMDNSLYQPRGVVAICDDNKATEAVKFWKDFLINIAKETGNENILAQINQSNEVKLARDSWTHVNFFFEPTISLKFKMAGHWTQEFLEENEVIITATKGTCQQIANGGNNQLAIQSNGDAVLCCFDFDGGTKIGNIKNHSLNEIDQRANYFRTRLVDSNNLPFKICRRCLGIRINFFSMGVYKCSDKKEILFNNIALYWLDDRGHADIKRLKQAGIPKLSILTDTRRDEKVDCLSYSANRLPDEVEAIIFPAEWIVDYDLIQKLVKRYPDKFIGQINIVALNPFARDRITAHRQNAPHKRQKSFLGKFGKAFGNIIKSLNDN